MFIYCGPRARGSLWSQPGKYHRAVFPEETLEKNCLDVDGSAGVIFKRRLYGGLEQGSDGQTLV